MAQHVHESSVFERRLRPIFESLEAGFNKKALQEVEKLLKKSPKLTCAKALKALALLRLGREDESNTLLLALCGEKPCDDATLQVLTFCYKELGQLEKICELYNYAVKKYPNNEELLAHLFMAYVRVNDYKSQHTTAIQLYKIKPKNPYYFWAVMSVVLQALRGPESGSAEKRMVFLALAQRMVDRLIGEDSLDAEQEVQLYLTILQEQGKYKEALEFIDSHICQKIYPGIPISMRIDFLKKMNMWDKVNILLKELLSDERDRWDYYKEYLASCCKLYEADSNTDDKKIMENCHEFLCQLVEAGKCVRGPYLARLELHKIMKQNNLNADELLGNFSDLIVEYFHRFGDKPCCTNDIALFLAHMDIDDQLSVSSRLLRDCGISSTTLPVTKEQMQKHICSLQISRICGKHTELTTEHRLAFYTALRLHYENGLNGFGRNLLPTDMGPSDAYALLAAHTMYDISLTESKSDFLIDALCLLHYVLRNSPSNFHAKLLAMKIYHLFGCALGANQIYELLDIKHIQLDSMGYLHCALLSSYGMMSIAKSVHDATLRFFSTSYKERLEIIVMSYKYGSFSKLQELMDFRERLSNSLHYSVISVEELLLEMICLSGTVAQNLNACKLMNFQPQEDRINWNKVSDNRDLSVVVQWDPIDSNERDNMANESFKQDVETLKIRFTLLRLVGSVIDLLNISNKSKSVNFVKSSVEATLMLLKETWTSVFKRLRLTNYKKMSNEYLVNLIPSRLHLMLDMPYEKFFSDVAQFVIETNSNSSDVEIEKVITLNDNVTKVSGICCDTIKEYNAAEDNIWIRRELQQKIVSAIEILSLYAFILSVCHEKFALSQNPQVKKNKRKEVVHEPVGDQNSTGNVNCKDRLTVIVELMRHMKRELHKCDNALGTWKLPQFHKSIDECMNCMSLNSEVEKRIITDVMNTFKGNHIETVKELRNLIKDKIRMVNK